MFGFKICKPSTCLASRFASREHLQGAYKLSFGIIFTLFVRGRSATRVQPPYTRQGIHYARQDVPATKSLQAARHGGKDDENEGVAGTVEGARERAVADGKNLSMYEIKGGTDDAALNKL